MFVPVGRQAVKERTPTNRVASDMNAAPHPRGHADGNERSVADFLANGGVMNRTLHEMDQGLLCIYLFHIYLVFSRETMYPEYVTRVPAADRKGVWPVGFSGPETRYGCTLCCKDTNSLHQNYISFGTTKRILNIYGYRC